MNKSLFFSIAISVCACGVESLDESHPDSTLSDAASEGGIQSPLPTCLDGGSNVVVSNGRAITTHHFSPISGVASGGVFNQGQWFPSAAGQVLQVPLPLEDTGRIDAVTLNGASATHASVSMYRLDAALTPPTFLGSASLQSVSPTGQDVWLLDTPHQISTSFENIGSELSAYWLEITSDGGSNAFGAIVVKTSTTTTSPNTPPSC